MTAGALILMLMLALGAATADASDKYLCTIVPMNDLRPGESPASFYKRLEGNRLYWKTLATAAKAARSAARNDYEFNAAKCAEKQVEASQKYTFEYWEETSRGISSRRISLGELVKMKNGLNVGFASKNRAFASDSVFEKYLKEVHPNDELSVRALYFGSKMPDLQACAARIDEGKSARVKPQWDLTLCNDHIGLDRYAFSEIGYNVKFENGVFVVDHSVSFAFSGSSKEMNEVMGRVLKLKYCVEKYYADHGIRLRLLFRTNPDDPDYTSSDSTVACVAHSNETHSQKWAIISYQQKFMSDEEVCSTMAHEIGHHFGLDDRYKDGCPASSEPEVSALNLMSSGVSLKISSTHLTSYQVRKIARPICGLQ